MAEQMEQNNAAVEIQRRKAIIEANAKQEGADKQHRENVPFKASERSPAVTSERMHLAEFARQDWIVNAEIEHTLDDCLRPSYWMHMAQQLSPYDHIEERSEDGTWIAQLVVMQVERAWAKVALMSKYEFKMETMPDAPREHVIEWKGAQHKHTVIRISDRALIRDGFKTKEEAEGWLREHERVVKS